ncbi:MAG: hypothetical protein ABI026_03735 [Gemmatimonadaceae bacterium]
MKRNRTASIILGMLCIITGCVKGDASHASATDSATAGARDSNGSAAAHDAVGDTAITVTAAGYGPVQIGMTVADAAIALNTQAQSMAGADSACSYVQFVKQPAGMRIMVVHDTVARIEIDSSNIATGLGARVGDSESRIHELYGSRMVVQPHKYDTAGHYLIVSQIPEANRGLKLVFETNGTKVTKYRAGRMPEVEFVEGCS